MRWSKDILLDFEMMPTWPHNTCLTSSWSRKKRLGAFAGTKTDGDKAPRNAVLAGRSAALLCFSCPSHPSSILQQWGPADGFLCLARNQILRKPHGRTQPLLPRADAKPKVRVRPREKEASTAQLHFSAAWESQVYSKHQKNKWLKEIWQSKGVDVGRETGRKENSEDLGREPIGKKRNKKKDRKRRK